MIYNDLEELAEAVPNRTAFINSFSVARLNHLNHCRRTLTFLRSEFGGY